ncbi:Nicotinate-nucleotide-dimethylbenzimidazole phosphoribosyltransferase like protein, partial [Aduncisulcus paluster]
MDRLTKPLGSLGRLEDLAVKMFVASGGKYPQADPARIYAIAGDHGVNEEDVIVDAGCKGGEFPEHPGLIQRKIACGTKNISKGPAMDKGCCLRAIKLGVELADEAHAQGIKVLGTGEMGVSNTTPSTALYCAYFDLDPADI